MKQLFAYSLLLSFLVLLAPRDVFHDCKHDSPTEQSTDHDSNNHESDCQICDYDLCPALQPPVFYFETLSASYFKTVSGIHVEPFVAPLDHVLHRGPPVMMF